MMIMTTAATSGHTLEINIITNTWPYEKSTVPLCRSSNSCCSDVLISVVKTSPEQGRQQMFDAMNWQIGGDNDSLLEASGTWAWHNP